MSNVWVKNKLLSETGATEEQGGGGTSLPWYARTRIFIDPEVHLGSEEGFEVKVVKSLRRFDHLPKSIKSRLAKVKKK